MKYPQGAQFDAAEGSYGQLVLSTLVDGPGCARYRCPVPHLHSLVLLALALAPSVHAQPLLPAPGAGGAIDDAIDAKLARLEKQFRTFAAPPSGLSLDASIPLAEDRALVAAFLHDDATDFAAFSAAQGRPRTAREVVSIFLGHNGHGAFGGAGVAADAYRLLALQRDGAHR